jgi:hypothetical protein
VTLLAGDFEHGWLEYEWRWKKKPLATALRTFRQPAWDGSVQLDRTILLYAEQGLGDTLQFIRYAPLVKQRCAKVVVECPKALLPLLGGCRGIDQILPTGNPLPEFDAQVPLLSLPRIFDTRLETIPADIPYLFADPRLIGQWRERLREAAGLKVGINWRSRPGYPWRVRNIPLPLFASLAEIPGVRLVSLQKAEGRVELAALRERFPIWDLGDDTLADTAAIIMNLDLVITSDTVVAHLAGGLGVPVWVALPYAPDWRWLLEREDSPWYRTMRLLRQKRWGDWEEVLARVAQALRERV